MNVLVVADTFPMPDRTSADFRLTELLGMIAEEHHVFFFAISPQNQIAALGKDEVSRYREMLANRGVTVVEGSLTRALKAREYAVVMFEWYFTARNLLAEIRARQPRARVIVDTVDVVFNRLEAKARLTQAGSDIAKAAETKSSGTCRVRERGYRDHRDGCRRSHSASGRIAHCHVHDTQHSPPAGSSASTAGERKTARFHRQLQP